MSALPLQEINHISRGFLLPRVNRAAGLVPSQWSAAQQFLFDAFDHFAYRLSDLLHRHLKSLSLTASNRAHTKARKVSHDAGKASHVSGQISQGRSHV